MNYCKITVSYILLIIACISCKVQEEEIWNTYGSDVRKYILDFEHVSDSASFPLWRIKEPKLFPLLDSLIRQSKKCIFDINEQPYYFELLFTKQQDTVRLYLRATQYSPSRFNYFYSEGEKYGACFYYQDRLFMVRHDRSINMSDLFTLTDKEETINLYYSTAIIYLMKKSYDMEDRVLFKYSYVNNEFMLNKMEPCEKVEVVYHTIKDGESLSDIAKKYFTSEKRILELNNFENGILPSKGKIRVQ